MSGTVGGAVQAAVDALRAAGIDVDTSLRATAYGSRGRAWVLVGAYERAGEGGVTLNVVVGAAQGHLNPVLDKAWAALQASPDIQPVTMEAGYGTTPVPGRDAPAGDVAVIEVATRVRLV